MPAAPIHLCCWQQVGVSGSARFSLGARIEGVSDDGGKHAIAVVLSGMGADGTEGLAAIQAAGGLTMAQQPETALFASMPEEAIAAGVEDALYSGHRCLVEWPEKAPGLLPPDTLSVRIEPVDEESRRLVVLAEQ